MTVLTAHKILISAAVALFLFYSAISLPAALAGDSVAVATTVASAVTTAGLAVYLRTVFAKSPRP